MKKTHKFTEADIFRICRTYRQADDKEDQLDILCQLYACSPEVIQDILNNHPDYVNEPADLELGKVENSMPPTVIVPSGLKSANDRNVPPIKQTPAGRLIYTAELLDWVKNQIAYGININDICEQLPGVAQSIKWSLKKHGVTWPDGRNQRKLSINNNLVVPDESKTYEVPVVEDDVKSDIDDRMKEYSEELYRISSSIRLAIEAIQSDMSEAKIMFSLGKHLSTAQSDIDNLVRRMRG